VLVGGRDDTLIWYTEAGGKTLNRVTQTSQMGLNLDFIATDLVLGEGDQMWATEAGHAVYQVRPFVNNVPFVDTVGGAVAVGPDKNVWYPTAGLMARLSLVEGTKYISIGNSVADQLCAGPDGAIWFTDGRHQQIGRLELNGDLHTFTLPFGSGPNRIIPGPDGALWFTAETGDKVGRITVQGDSTQYPIPTNGGFPHALTVGSDGYIWFTEMSSGKIGRLIPDPY
jgi:virginiamycin B lyase